LLWQCKGYFYADQYYHKEFDPNETGFESISSESLSVIILKRYLEPRKYDIGNIILFVIIVGIDITLRARVLMLE